MLYLGAFPEVSVVDARKKRANIREQVAARVNRSVKKRVDKITGELTAANTFGAVADEHLANLQNNGAAEQTMSKKHGCSSPHPSARGRLQK
jgi:uncharacterized protein (UPF0218 family)